MPKNGNAAKLPSQFKNIQKLVDDVYRNSTSPWVVTYSGGKDSSVVLDMFLRSAKKYPDGKHIYVVSNNTRVESPLVIGQLEKMHKILRRYIEAEGLKVSVHMTEPPLYDSFWVNLIGKGYPAPNQMFRWCTSRLKIDPTSAFIDRTIGNKDLMMSVGTRAAESASRKRNIDKHSVSEFFSTHTTRQNTQIFMPIRYLTDDDVWEYLASVTPPWGGDYMDLINLYREAYGGECPVVADASALSQPSCGERSPRFGCWTCTLVKDDSSLQGLIASGYMNLKPLYDFRNWLVETRDDITTRLPFNRQGQTRYKNGLLVYGPYRLEHRLEILTKLMTVQKTVGANLILDQEIDLIHDLWEEDRVFFQRYIGVRIPLNKFDESEFVTF
ncbi:DNA phosphorothioation system sulfurtransferase DndC [Candidatus Puniceispirillum marinum]|nr:DNA phosphorothioation system sulfurtransferase DndC [Candidatus Puniceispirillum marinum]